MKLFLSSYELGAAPEELQALCPQARAGVIMNGLDARPDLRSIRWQDQQSHLKNLGFSVPQLDLRTFFATPDALSDALNLLDMVWVNGGDAFVLRRAMRQSGFDRLITARVQSSQIVYGGFSAGAIVAAPTLMGVDIATDPRPLPDGYQQDVVWEGLGLVPFSMIVHHMTTGKRSAASRQEAEFYKAAKMPFHTIKDGEALVIDGDIASMRKVGRHTPKKEEAPQP